MFGAGVGGGGGSELGVSSASSLIPGTKIFPKERIKSILVDFNSVSRESLVLDHFLRVFPGAAKKKLFGSSGDFFPSLLHSNKGKGEKESRPKKNSSFSLLVLT